MIKHEVYPVAVVPNLFGIRDWFHEREFFMDVRRVGVLDHITFIVHFVSVITSTPQITTKE